VCISMGKVFRALEKYKEGLGVEAEGDKGRLGSNRALIHSEILDATEAKEPRLPDRHNTPTGHWDERLLKVTGFSGQLSESFRVLRSRILHPSDDGKNLKTILVTSTAPGEGKSFVTANLGISLARGMDQYCLMVDCDLRRPTLAAMLGMGNDPGLSDYLQAGYDVPQVIQKTTVQKLSLLASGIPPVNPSELLGSARMQGLVEQLSARYDDRFVIFDSPPIQAASETSVLAKQVDGVVLVIRWGASGRDHVRRLVEDIGKEKIIGVIFNGYKSNIVESKLLKYSDHYQYDYTHK
jgi:protein-tyrosine kinase